MKPTVSVLVPTRKRVALLGNMLQSLLMTASDGGTNVEVVCRVDFDDEESIRFLRDWGLTFIVGQRYDGYATLAKLINEAARFSHADLVIVVNDDVEFKTGNWDQLLKEAADRYLDGVYDLGVDTVMNNENYVFPCISRRVIDALGFFFDERLVYPDIWLRDVMASLGRAIRVPEVTIEHKWVGLTDDQRRAMRRVQTGGYQDLYDRCVGEAVQKLRELVCEQQVVRC